MKVIFSYCMLLMFLLACKKKETLFSSVDEPLIASAKNFFYQQNRLGRESSKKEHLNPRRDLSKLVHWQNAKVINSSNGQTVIVPVTYQNPFLIRTNFSGSSVYNINDLTKLSIHRDLQGRFHSELLTYFPDSDYKNAIGESFKGIVVVEDWSGKILKKLKFEKGNKIKVFDLSQMDQSSLFSVTKSPKLQSAMDEIPNRMASITVCYYIEGYNSSGLDIQGYYWSELIGCNSYTFNIDDGGGYGGNNDSHYADIGGGGGGFPTANTFTLTAGDNVIANISDYLKCFDNMPGTDHKYKITLCVSQPNPGTRETWGFTGSNSAGNAVFVGHVFLILSETTSNKTITRNVGFYPGGDVWPYSPKSQGQLNNDANQDYNISLTITTTSSQFQQVLDYISLGNNAGFTYDLNTNNCTTFALDALKAGGINLPRTNGSWLNGSGLNPGDLGEDIRKMSLSPNMSRSGVYNYHPNLGTCY